MCIGQLLQHLDDVLLLVVDIVYLAYYLVYLISGGVCAFLSGQPVASSAQDYQDNRWPIQAFG
jgi:hypothetical protein